MYRWDASRLARCKHLLKSLQLVRQELVAQLDLLHCSVTSHHKLSPQSRHLADKQHVMVETYYYYLYYYYYHVTITRTCCAVGPPSSRPTTSCLHSPDTLHSRLDHMDKWWQWKTSRSPCKLCRQWWTWTKLIHLHYPDWNISRAVQFANYASNGTW